MKKVSITLIALFSFLISFSQQEGNEVKIGQSFTIQSPSGYSYTHIDMPRANFIIKTGGIANYKKLAGVQVEVTEIKNTSKGETKVVLKRKDGKKFFGSFPAVTANYKEAIKAGELK